MANVSSARTNFIPVAMRRIATWRKPPKSWARASGPVRVLAYGHYPGGQSEYLRVPQFKAGGCSALVGDPTIRMPERLRKERLAISSSVTLSTL